MSAAGPAGTSLRDVVAEAGAQLAAAGVQAPDVDARMLLAHVLGVGAGELQRRLVLGDDLDAVRLGELAALVRRRCAREPLQHLTGRAPFRRLELLVGPGVFVPRPETEAVAALAIEAAAAVLDTEPLVVDLCTGSAAIALAVADEVPEARVVAVELDPAAVLWARRNVDAYRGGRARVGERVDLRAGDVARCDVGLLADLAGEVDVVVSNPPYIPPGATPVDPEVRDHDPVLALYGGGDDGLAVPAAVVQAAAGLLVPGGLLVMEHAEVQAEQARALATDARWTGVHTRADLTGRPRMLVARRTGAGVSAAGPRVGDFPS